MIKASLEDRKIHKYPLLFFSYIGRRILTVAFIECLSRDYNNTQIIFISPGYFKITFLLLGTPLNTLSLSYMGRLKFTSHISS